jgi:hypothetical protein
MFTEIGDALRGFLNRRSESTSTPHSEPPLPSGAVIDFDPIDPLDETNYGVTFKTLTLPWIRSRCTEGVYWQGHGYRRHKSVRIRTLESHLIEATTQGRIQYRQKLEFRAGEFSAECSCSDFQKSGSPTSLCRHCVAVLLEAIEHAEKMDALDLRGECVCPVTRMKLKPGMPLFRCINCKMTYSREGWEFLRDVARGECCGCRSTNTIQPYRSGPR